MRRDRKEARLDETKEAEPPQSLWVSSLLHSPIVKRAQPSQVRPTLSRAPFCRVMGRLFMAPKPAFYQLQSQKNNQFGTFWLASSRYLVLRGHHQEIAIRF